MNARLLAAGLLGALSLACAAHAAELAPSTLAAAAVGGNAGCAADDMLTPLQRRLLAKYDQSVEILEQYVQITEPVHHLDRMQAALWAEQYRKTHSKC